MDDGSDYTTYSNDEDENDEDDDDEYDDGNSDEIDCESSFYETPASQSNVQLSRRKVFLPQLEKINEHNVSRTRIRSRWKQQYGNRYVHYYS